jgi:hypothetical protein
MILGFGLSTWLFGNVKLSKLISDVVEFIGVMWLGDGLIGWSEEGNGKR